MLDTFFNKYIGRIVTFVLTPLLAVLVPPVEHGLNSVLGTNFSDQQLSNMAIATVVGLAIVAYKWLHNRGVWEIVNRDVEKLVAAEHQGSSKYAGAGTGGDQATITPTRATPADHDPLDPGRPRGA